MRPARVEISYKTILFVFLLLFFFWFLFAIRDVLLAVFIALIIMSALNPLVNIFERFKLPRILSILLIFAIILIIFSGMIASIVPALVYQTRSLINQIPTIAENLGIHTIDQRVLSDQLGSIPGNIAKVVINMFSNIVAVFTVFVLSFYLLAERANLHKNLISFFGNQDLEKNTEQFIDKLEHQIGNWVRGQLALMFIIGIMTYVGLLLLKVNFSLALAIIAGILEIVPGIGPTLAMIPAVLVAFSNSPITAIATLALYFLIQQFENNFIVPKVMQAVVGVKPFITIISIMIGVKLAGVLGAILAIPTYLVTRLIIEEYYNSKRISSA